MSVACRICGATELETVLDFGKVALADSFLPSLDAVSDEPRYPLTLAFCEKCAHLQIREILDPALLFSNYVWETGIPASIQAYCRTFADQVLQKALVPATARVLEVASNDGTMLREFQSRGFTVLGVDPARNIAEKARARGIDTVADFFNERVAREVHAARGSFALIVARNVLAHVADLHGLVEGIKLLLAPGGTAVIEVPHLLTMFDELQYDQVFHEHIGYHSLDSIRVLADLHGLAVVDVDSAWVHGGSIRAYLRPKSDQSVASGDVAALLARERASGILGLDAWRQFAARAHRQKALLREELAAVKRAGGTVAGYGASGKGQSLIQFCDIDPTMVSYIVDKSTMKIGKWTPGSHIPILATAELRRAPPDVLLLFAWNFTNEILEQEKELHAGGVRFLHPIPVPHYV